MAGAWRPPPPASGARLEAGPRAFRILPSAGAGAPPHGHIAPRPEALVY